VITTAQRISIFAKSVVFWSWNLESTYSGDQTSKWKNAPGGHYKTIGCDFETRTNPMACGDHIRARRFGYWHHGIDCGDGTVIHYEGELFRAKDAKVRRVTWHEFARNGDCLLYTSRCV